MSCDLCCDMGCKYAILHRLQLSIMVHAQICRAHRVTYRRTSRLLIDCTLTVAMMSTQHGKLACLGRVLWESKKHKEAPTAIIQQATATTQPGVSAQPVVFAAGPGMYYAAEVSKQQVSSSLPASMVFAPQQPPQPQFTATNAPAVSAGPFMWSGSTGAVPSGFAPRTLHQQPVQVVSPQYAGHQSYGAFAPQQPVIQQCYGLTADGRQVWVQQ